MDWLLLGIMGLTLLTVLGGGLLGLLLSVGALKLERQQHAARLESLSRALGLTVQGDTLTGPIADHPAVVAHRTIERRSGNRQDGIIVRIGGLPRDLALRGGQRSSGQPRTGDPHLDRHWTIAAHDGAVGRLSAPARHELERLRRLSERITVEGGVLEVHFVDDHTLLELMPSLRTVVTSLGSDGVTAELVRRIEGDPHGPVRATMLWHLARVDRPRAKQMAAEHPSTTPEELLVVGSLLHDAECVARCMDHPDASLKLAQRAAERWLEQKGDADHAMAALARHHGAAGVRAMAQALYAAGAPDLEPVLIARVPQLAEHHRAHPHDARAALVAVAWCLQHHGTEQSQPALLSLLAVEDDGIRRAAIGALGALGTVQAVAPLRASIERVSALSGLRGLAQQAINAIKARASGVAGGLAIADPAPMAGALSVGAHDHGALSDVPTTSPVAEPVPLAPRHPIARREPSQ